MVPKIVASLVLGVLALLLAYFWRHFPLRLAVVSGLSVGVLTFSTLQVTGRLRRLYRR